MTKTVLLKHAQIVVLLFLVFSTSISGLSLSGEKQYNTSAYADSLMQEQLQLTQKVAQLKQEMGNVRSIFQNTTITNNLKLTQASEGIADERNTLYDMQKILQLPWQLRQCKCANLDQANRNRVNQKIGYISGLISDMRTSLKKCDQVRCPRYQEIAMELSQSLNYLNIMNQTINSECCKGEYQFKPERPTGLVDLSNTIYKDNLNAKNWYYGDIDKKTYILKSFELSTKYNLTSCPLDTPYSDLLSNTCLDCPVSTSFFNLGSRACLSCLGYNKYLDLTTSQCKQCPFAQFYNKTSSSCSSCPQQKYFNTTTISCQSCTGINQYVSIKDNKCVKCDKEMYYDQKDKVCRSCDIVGGKFLNKTTNLCQDCPLGTRYVTGTGACLECSGGAHYDIAMGKCVICPTSTFYIKQYNSCMTCPSGSFYSNNTKSCLTCPSGTTYNSTLNTCASSAPAPTPTPTHPNQITCPKQKPYYLHYQKICSECPENQFFDPSTHVCKLHNFISICPPDRPVYNDSTFACMPCPKNSTFDPMKNICKNIQCTDTQYFDIETLKCVDTPIVVVATNNTPNTTKVSCTDQQYYDQLTNTCKQLSEKCNAAVQLYSDALKKCVPFDQACGKGYYFDTNQKNCVSVATLCKFNQYYSYKASQCLPISTTCGPDQYFNQTLTQCSPRSSQCTPTQYYNTTLHSCRESSQRCSTSQTFSLETGKCIPISSTCTIDQSYNSITFKCQAKSLQCNIDQVYSVQKHSCLQKELFCTNSQFYSRVLHACVEGGSYCHLNQIFDKPTNSCKLISSFCQANGTVYDVQANRCFKTCQIGYILDKSKDQCIQSVTPTTSVTPTSPNLTFGDWRDCLPDQTFLGEIQACVKTIETCKDNQFYNWQILKCRDVTYITSPYSPNLLSQDSPFSTYENYIKSKILSFQDIPDGIRECPRNKPHYDPNQQVCFLCSDDKFLFDVVNNVCTSCSASSKYSPLQHRCVSR